MITDHRNDGHPWAQLCCQKTCTPSTLILWPCDMMEHKDTQLAELAAACLCTWSFISLVGFSAAGLSHLNLPQVPTVSTKIWRKAELILTNEEYFYIKYPNLRQDSQSGSIFLIWRICGGFIYLVPCVRWPPAACALLLL